LDRVWPHTRFHVARHDPHCFPEAEAAQRIGGLEWIVEALSAIENSRQPRHLEEFVFQELTPEILDRLDLGKKSVAANVEAKILVARGSGYSPNYFVALQHDDRTPALRQQIRGGEPRRPGTDY